MPFARNPPTVEPHRVFSVFDIDDDIPDQLESEG